MTGRFDPIVCATCGQSVWCLKIMGSWTCKNCFLDSGGSMAEWNQLNEEAKAEREAKKKLREIDGAIDNSRGFGKNSRKPVEPKECKYCKAMIIWDYKQEGRNKFVDVNTKQPHRCG